MLDYRAINRIILFVALAAVCTLGCDDAPTDGGMGGTGGVAGEGGEGGQAGTGGVAGEGGEGGQAGEGGEGGQAGEGGEGGEGGQAGEGGMVMPAGSILDVLNDDGRFTSLLAAIEAAGLGDSIAGDAITLFAPTDEAFEAVEGLAMLLEDAEALAAVLGYHVVDGELSSAEIAERENLPTRAGRFLAVAMNEDGALTVAGVPVAEADVPASNGVIHVVGSVLTPPEAQGVSCENPDVVEGDAVRVGSTVGIGRAVHRFTAGAEGRLCISTIGSAFDTRLELYRDCTTNSEFSNAESPSVVVTLADGSTAESQVPGYPEARIELSDVLVGDRIDVVVTSASPFGEVEEEGDYRLEITAGACPSITLVDVLGRLGNYGTFLSLLEAAELEETVARGGSFTVLAPTDAAFMALELEEPGLLELIGEDFAELEATLRYHLIQGAHQLETLGALETVESDEGSSLAITSQDGQVFFNGVPVVGQDLAASNGFIQSVEGVLLPPERCSEVEPCEEGEECSPEGQCLPIAPPATLLAQLQVNAATFSDFLDVINAAELEAAFESDDLTTVFAPSNAAFDGLDVAAILAADPDALIGRIQYHMVVGYFGEADLAAAQSLPTVAGREIEIRNDNGMVSVGSTIADVFVGGTVVATDLLAANGVIHTLDTFMELPNIDACDDVRELGLDFFNVTDPIDTTNLGSNYGEACSVGGATGPEVAFVWSSSEDRRICVHTMDSAQNFDTVIYVNEGICAGGDQVACNDDCDTDGDGREFDDQCGFGEPDEGESAVTVEVVAGVEYYFFVDGKFGQLPGQEAEAGEFVLTIEEGGCFEERPAGSVMDALRANDNYSRFVEAVEGTALSIALGGNGQHTVFVPTNAAFDAVDPQTEDDLMDPARRLSLLRHHVAAGRYDSAELMGVARVEDLEARPISVDEAAGTVSLPPATVTVADGQAVNGLIHEIDAVLPIPAACGDDNPCPMGDYCGGAGFCEYLPRAGTCGNPIEIVNLPEPSSAGNNADGRQMHEGTCGQATSREVVYRIDGANDFVGCDQENRCRICAQTLPGLTNFDTVIYVRRGENSCEVRAEELTCDDDGGIVIDVGVSAVDFLVEPDETYFLFVDGRDGALGEYDLAVTQGPCQ